jgi:hypothetical protein
MKTRFHEEARHTAFCLAETIDIVSAGLKLQPSLLQAWHLSGKVLEHAHSGHEAILSLSKSYALKHSIPSRSRPSSQERHVAYARGLVQSTV